jgi:hypothetical protein
VVQHNKVCKVTWCASNTKLWLLIAGRARAQPPVIDLTEDEPPFFRTAAHGELTAARAAAAATAAAVYSVQSVFVLDEVPRATCDYFFCAHSTTQHSIV